MMFIRSKLRKTKLHTLEVIEDAHPEDAFILQFGLLILRSTVCKLTFDIDGYFHTMI